MSIEYYGLPFEFESPRHAAQHIAQLSTLAERNAYFDRIPAHFQKMIRHLAMIEIAAGIVAIEDLAQRREALTRVPYEWRDELRSHVLRLWRAPAAAQRTGAAA